MAGEAAAGLDVQIEQRFEVALFGGLAAAEGDLTAASAAVGHHGHQMVPAFGFAGLEYVDYLFDYSFLGFTEHG